MRIYGKINNIEVFGKKTVITVMNNEWKVECLKAGTISEKEVGDMM